MSVHLYCTSSYRFTHTSLLLLQPRVISDDFYWLFESQSKLSNFSGDPQSHVWRQARCLKKTKLSTLAVLWMVGALENNMCQQNCVPWQFNGNFVLAWTTPGPPSRPPPVPITRFLFVTIWCSGIIFRFNFSLWVTERKFWKMIDGAELQHTIVKYNNEEHLQIKRY